MFCPGRLHPCAYSNNKLLSIYLLRDCNTNSHLCYFRDCNSYNLINFRLLILTEYISDPTWDLVPLGGNVYLLGYELYFLLVKTILKYSLWNLRYASLKLPMSPDLKTP